MWFWTHKTQSPLSWTSVSPWVEGSVERTRLQGSQSPFSLLTRSALKVVPPSPTLPSTPPQAGPSALLHLPLPLLCLSRAGLGLASSFLNCQDHSSTAKLSCHPHRLSLPAHVSQAGLLSPWDWGVAGALNSLLRDWLSAPRQARCEMSVPGGAALRKRLNSFASGKRDAPNRQHKAAESMCLQLTRAAQSRGCRVTASCVSGCENVCVCE